MGSTDIILGIQWLETSGMMHIDWRQQMMKFQLGGSTINLKDDPSLGKSLVLLKAMKWNLRRECYGILVEFNNSESQVAKDSLTPSYLQNNLQQYELAFQILVGMPPSKVREPSITLKESTTPISVCPYQYPHTQKEELDRLIGETLAVGIIKPSSSLFSNLVLLIKKKDGSGRFYADYKALNKVIMPDKYLIHVIEELLYELHGATVFSKLDLKSRHHQIRVKQEDVPKTAFITHNGQYEFLVMPLSLMNAPANFQSLMNDIFRPFLQRYVFVFFLTTYLYIVHLKSFIKCTCLGCW